MLHLHKTYTLHEKGSYSFPSSETPLIYEVEFSVIKKDRNQIHISPPGKKHMGGFFYMRNEKRWLRTTEPIAPFFLMK